MRIFILILCFLIVACGGGPVAQSVNFLDYYLLDRTAQGTLVDIKGNRYSAWQTNLISSSQGKINWSETEIFSWDSQWIYLNGYHNPNPNMSYSQYAVKQTYCRGTNCTVYDNVGLAKHAPINPIEDYTLDTIGYIVEDTTGKRVNFRDFQRVRINVPCSNPYHSNQTCIIQDEQWWDDNLSTFSLKYDRETYFAKNLGIGFILNDRLAGTTAYLK